MQQTMKSSSYPVLIIAFILLLGHTERINALDHDPLQKEISLHFGAFSPIAPEQYPTFCLPSTRVEFSYFIYNGWGLRSGFRFTNPFPGCRSIYSVPLQVCYRTNSFTFDPNEMETENLGETIFYSFMSLMPINFEFNGGVNLGYADTHPVNRDPVKHQTTQESYYGVYQNIYGSLNAGTRMNFQIWHFNLFFDYQLNYLPTRNFSFYSNYGKAKGYTPTWLNELSGGLQLRF